MRPPLTDIRELVRMLAAQAPSLAAELLPHGRKDGHEWRCGSLHGEPGRSLAVHLSGPKAGVWCDFASGEAGDALDLVAAVHFSGDKGRAVAWSRRWLGLDAGTDPDDAERRRRLTQRALSRAPSADDQAARQQSQRAAIAMWLNAAPRFAPQLMHPSGQKFPAMLAAITNENGAQIGTHRTWLAQDARTGRWGKAPVEPAKASYGAVKGGTIRLWRGASSKPLIEAPPDDVVAIAEGIEDALTVALACPDWRVLAAVSIGNMAAIVLPPQCSDIVLIADRDGENPQTRRAREAALDRWLNEGRAVRVAEPPRGFKDWNAWLQAEAAAEAATGEKQATEDGAA
jgi:hypothetical protein